MPGEVAQGHDVRFDRDNGGRRRLTCRSCGPAGLNFVADQLYWTQAEFGRAVAGFLNTHPPVGGRLQNDDRVGPRSVTVQGLWAAW